MRRRVSCFLMVLAFGAASACSDDDVPAKADSQVVAEQQRTRDGVEPVSDPLGALGR